VPSVTVALAWPALACTSLMSAGCALSVAVELDELELPVDELPKKIPHQLAVAAIAPVDRVPEGQSSPATIAIPLSCVPNTTGQAQIASSWDVG